MGLKVQSSFMDWRCIPAGKVGHSPDTSTSSFGTWAGQSLARASCCHCNVWLRHVQCLCCLHGGCNLDQEHATTGWGGMSCSRMWSNLEGECQVSKAICLDSAVKIWWIMYVDQVKLFSTNHSQYTWQSEQNRLNSKAFELLKVMKQIFYHLFQRSLICFECLCICIFLQNM
jgi:hypothetical protein